MYPAELQAKKALSPIYGKLFRDLLMCNQFSHPKQALQELPYSTRLWYQLPFMRDMMARSTDARRTGRQTHEKVERPESTESILPEHCFLALIRWAFPQGLKEALSKDPAPAECPPGRQRAASLAYSQAPMVSSLYGLHHRPTGLGRKYCDYGGLLPLGQRPINLPALDNWLMNSAKTWEEAHVQLQHIVRSQQRFANCHHRPTPMLRPGQKVWVSTQGMTKGPSCPKLSPRYINTFEPVHYSPFLVGSAPVALPAPLDVEGQPAYLVPKILDSYRCQDDNETVLEGMRQHVPGQESVSDEAKNTLKTPINIVENAKQTNPQHEEDISDVDDIIWDPDYTLSCAESYVPKHED
ncbi:hypothetical protein P4O66_001161 [Electrophorus voltai]|uniref:Uncharacterized protein n=1 Tax=Electrophorus voltai TaxID=2609070 RepID=A0AAD8ZCR6_9TELE|nr:hypothetical protein P4O66_001161 [Electrophorus voltai]